MSTPITSSGRQTIGTGPSEVSEGSIDLVIGPTSITALYQKAIESVGKSGGAGAEFRETPAFKILGESHLSQDPLVRPQALLDRTRLAGKVLVFSADADDTCMQHYGIGHAGAMHQDLHVTEGTFAEDGTPGQLQHTLSTREMCLV